MVAWYFERSIASVGSGEVGETLIENAGRSRGAICPIVACAA